MRERAKVVEISDECVVVEVERSTACEECGKCMIGQKNRVVRAKTQTKVNVKVGDIVTVDMQTPNLYKATLIMYGIPLLMFFIGVAAGYFLLASRVGVDPNLLGALTGFVLLAVSYYVIRKFEQKGAFDKDFKMTIVED